MALYSSARRYFHGKRLNARERGDFELEMVWRSKQEGCSPATPLPATVPYKAELHAHGYDTFEDLAGVDADELLWMAELTALEAADVLTWLVANEPV